MILVTTPTGNIGSRVVLQLLAANKPVRVIARDPNKLSADVRSRVDVVQGATDDEAVLRKAFDGADSLFWVVPPSFTMSSANYYTDFTAPLARILPGSGIQRVVDVSGIGRKYSGPAGIVTGSLEKELQLEATGVACRALWCPGFMENFLQQLQPLKSQGAFYLPTPPDMKSPLVATQDIGDVAARLLADTSWTGTGGVAVLGPENLSPNDMAAILTDVLGKPIRYQPLPLDAYQAQLLQHGASETFATGLTAMYAAKNNGMDLTEARTPDNTTPTTFRQWAEQSLKPAFLA